MIAIGVDIVFPENAHCSDYAERVCSSSWTSASDPPTVANVNNGSVDFLNVTTNPKVMLDFLHLGRGVFCLGDIASTYDLLQLKAALRKGWKSFAHNR